MLGAKREFLCLCILDETVNENDQSEATEDDAIDVDGGRSSTEANLGDNEFAVGSKDEEDGDGIDDGLKTD